MKTSIKHLASAYPGWVAVVGTLEPDGKYTSVAYPVVCWALIADDEIVGIVPYSADKFVPATEIDGFIGYREEEIC